MAAAANAINNTFFMICLNLVKILVKHLSVNSRCKYKLKNNPLLFLFEIFNLKNG